MRVLITGAASGLGEALAKVYAKRHAGVQICVADIHQERGLKVVEELQAMGADAWFQMCDITNQEQVDVLTETVKTRWMGLDVLVNNAGVATAGGLQFEDLEQWQWVMDINVLGMVRMTKALVPLMQLSNDGTSAKHIINTASQAGITPAPMMGSYNVSKAAVVSFSETMHVELAPEKIHVSVACPAFFDTRLDESLRSHQPGMQELVRKLLERANMTAEQVAEAIISGAEKGDFMHITHKEGRSAYRFKCFLPWKTYLNMMIKRTARFGRGKK